ncbi:MAG: hypothetical protein J6Q10_01600 [Clostridia bacterium]|nr:hypothetical protein [Clostridia bacterium]
MSCFKVGYATTNINPMLGIALRGYFVPRYAKGFLDDLEAQALALSCGNEKVLMISVDACMLEEGINELYKSLISKATGLAEDKIFMSATHTHTGPMTINNRWFEADDEMIEEYKNFLGKRLVDLSVLALNDLKPAKMGFIEGKAPDRIAYIRRYKMKDGTTCTCPTINDPNIEHPIGELDQRVHILRFDQENGESIVLLNYGLHADTVNGEMISSDWVGWLRRTVEKALDGVKCITFVGAQGDVGSTHVFPSGGDMNDTEISFDNEMKSPGMARFVGRALAGVVLQVYDKVEYVDVDGIEIIERAVEAPANVPSPEDIPLARQYKKLHDEGKDSEIPYEAMELTTVVAEALRMCRLENGPESFRLNLMGLRIGPVALIGIPGEPFTDVGVGIKDTPGWKAILPCALTNGYMGYFPMMSAYDEGGYEARSSNYKGGVAELIIEKSKEILKELEK